MVITILLVACEYNVHKGNCFEAIEDCPGPKKKRKQLPAAVLMPAVNPRKPSQSSTTKSNNNNWNSESQDEDQETQNGVDSKSKRSSLDGDSISSGKDMRSEIEFSRSIDREHLSSGDVSVSIFVTSAWLPFLLNNHFWGFAIVKAN
ncbi:PREDICTED: uncharacterized protein LOC107328784 [Acropora digitifera]|uniref:uncharacterized protein LOC107328784 n=1 Tax=Acropora digitifera TaxID=70779 RepID=UPI000779F74A|nr:PREDICTED: uncharacterized protein LOC107328784 [Acropora digitifera]